MLLTFGMLLLCWYLIVVWALICVFVGLLFVLLNSVVLYTSYLVVGFDLSCFKLRVIVGN